MKYSLKEFTIKVILTCMTSFKGENEENISYFNLILPLSRSLFLGKTMH